MKKNFVSNFCVYSLNLLPPPTNLGKTNSSSFTSFPQTFYWPLLMNITIKLAFQSRRLIPILIKRKFIISLSGHCLPSLASQFSGRNFVRYFGNVETKEHNYFTVHHWPGKVNKIILTRTFEMTFVSHFLLFLLLLLNFQNLPRSPPTECLSVIGAPANGSLQFLAFIAVLRVLLLQLRIELGTRTTTIGTSQLSP